MFSIKEINDYLNDIKGTDVPRPYIEKAFSAPVIEELNKIESEENKVDVKDILINKLIEKDAIELKQKLIEEIDKQLGIIHKVLIGETTLFCTGFSDIEEAQNEFDALVTLRKTFNADVAEFLKLNIEDIIGYSSIFITPNIIHELKKIIEHI